MAIKLTNRIRIQKRITSSCSIPSLSLSKALSYPWMGRVKAETRSKKRERETLVFRGAHFAVPWRACSISTSCIVQTRRSHPTSDIRIPPRIHTDTHVFTKGVARREGCLPPCRQSWYCAPAYTYVTRDLRRYTVSGPYSTAALKTGRIGTQLPAP